MDMAISKASENPDEVLKQISTAIDLAKENANAYNTSRVIGRVVTGVVLSPLGALATIGDINYGIEQGRIGIDQHLEQALYGND